MQEGNWTAASREFSSTGISLSLILVLEGILLCSGLVAGLSLMTMVPRNREYSLLTRSGSL